MTDVDLAARLKLHRSRDEWRGTCPCCGYENAFALSVGKAGRLLGWCASCENKREIAQLLAQMQGGGAAPEQAEHHDAAVKEARRLERAMALWHVSEQVPGTLAERYLAVRGLPHLVASAALRHHPDCPHPSRSRLPALIALVQGVDGGPVGIHRTYLRRDGSGKADIEPPRAAFGPVRGGAVRLDPAARRDYHRRRRRKLGIRRSNAPPSRLGRDLSWQHGARAGPAGAGAQRGGRGGSRSTRPSCRCRCVAALDPRRPARAHRHAAWWRLQRHPCAPPRAEGTAMSALAAIREAAERLAEADEDERAVRLRPEAKQLGVRINYLEAAIRRRQAAQEAEAEAAPEQPNSELAPEDPDLVVVDQPGETDAEAIARLARMPVLEYERQRDAAAALLGIPRVAILDRFVNAARRSGRNAHDEQRTLQGHALVMIEPAPWPQPVNGAALLDEVAASISRHVVLPTGGSVAVALWCVHTFLLDAFRHSPRLAISSSDPDCGKTTLLDIVALLIFRPLSTSGISSAAFYRTVERAHPSLLADEADSWLHENEELRGCLNAGHKRGGRMIKCVGEDFEPRAFDVFCALAIAMIGLPPATGAKPLDFHPYAARIAG